MFLAEAVLGEHNPQGGIVGVTPEVEMREVAPGLYETQQQLPFNMQPVNNGIIEVILQRGGQKTTQTSPSPITIAP